MVNIKTKSDYVITDNFKPGPKNGHLSVKDPNFAEVEAATVEALAPLWEAAVPLDKFKEGWVTAPPAIPDGCPEPGKDVFISQMKVTVRDGTEIEIQIYRPPELRTDAALVFRMHGGGWTVGSHSTSLRFHGDSPVPPSQLTRSSRAPEFPYPYPIEDSWDVLKWCKVHAKYLGVNPEKIILAGNSGGGNMAACLAIKARDEGLTGIVAQSLVFPVTCHPKFFSEVPNKEKYELLSYSQNHQAAIVDSYRMEFFWDQYVGTDPKPDPGHSPLLHQLKDLKGLPPAFVHAAGLDPLRDEGIAYAEALKAAGNDVQLAAYPGLPHCFYMFVGFKQTKDYFERVIGFVKKHADAGPGQAKSHI
ncbi:hypothetical protein PFICI_06648 [Pestalotiopsis fici W106-1]|uniref:Alpha/beta hydrolase fold-3 domain-containing protein n=1 Tax=Pestalotiopsis fici (strain W106-1 / CGMCC3.15140) TaxID=1229662 RepID=W3X8Z5_PESFW|nr:uncharacterized protein PFICI_06648 [Pestalotiopsis fici W106-1]ETS81646.1 hypothetical protein PFICI_06648 [Pestalotiopsis fici W106-1]